jgi:NAD(P)-dependent dehydrogenase (short-subunit alcohol dehydrogenase family)
MGRLDDEVAVIAGGSSGIGRATRLERTLTAGRVMGWPG